MRILLLILTTLIFAGCAEITNFEECVAAGNPVMESYPEQCRTEDGKLFVREIAEPVIGGDKDEHGCLVPAGFSWNSSLGACVREWELDAEARQAVELVVSTSDEQLTIVSAVEKDCDGCYDVVVEAPDGQKTIQLIDWKVDSVHVCTEIEKTSVMCTKDYRPVCGDDKKTYSNGCMACSSGEVDYWKEGVCAEAEVFDKTCTPTSKMAEVCTMDYNPVCGDDGETYGNPCMGCSSGNIDKYFMGACAP
ncbi:hypothetical protein H6504_04230 [Candidatus Woesearchaeota archaeon]|nr:hypothetical protein [Candidatus Woesearchaeota archaeon]